MIDRKEPFNSLPKLPSLGKVNFDDPDILKKSISASRSLAALNQAIVSDKRNIAHSLNMMSPLFVPEAVASSGVENIITTNEAVYQTRLFEDDAMNPSTKEAIRYVDALGEGFLRLVKQKYLATNDYIALQRILEPNRHGIRKLPGTQLANPVTKEIYYTPPVGEARLRNLLDNLEKYFNEESPPHEVLTRAAIIHYQFEAIHPFPDGNGRTGRMLIPLYLTTQKVLYAPLLFVSKFILDNRDEYYAKLRGVTFDKDWRSWIMYMLEALEKQADYTLSILSEIQSIEEKLEDKLEDVVGHGYARHTANVLFSEPYFTQAVFQKELKISYATSRKYLGLLEVGGIIVKAKQDKKNRYLYTCPDYIKLLKRV